MNSAAHGISENDNDLNFDRTIKTQSPTFVVYAELQEAYRYFNAKLFNSELPECVLTLYYRSKKTMGYFRADGFAKNEDGALIDEIALNPKIFDVEDLTFVLSVLVHEMAHLWRHHFGQPKRKKPSGYHCKVWGKKMESIGLIPSNTGLPDGKKTGFQMMHYIFENGRFDCTCSAFINDGFALTWAHIQKLYASKGAKDEIGAGTTDRDKEKFQCPVCNACVWGKPTTNVFCGKDRVNMLKAK
jgi:hypothetical protein